MADHLSKKGRSRVMRGIRSADTKPEMTVRRYLHGQGFRYRLHARDLPGKPDIVLPRYRSIVLVHGCFWHIHKGCPRAAMPATNSDYWTPKLLRNVQRDRETRRALQRMGWRVKVIWECSLTEGALRSLAQWVERGADPLPLEE